MLRQTLVRAAQHVRRPAIRFPDRSKKSQGETLSPPRLGLPSPPYSHPTTPSRLASPSHSPLALEQTRTPPIPTQQHQKR
ncbi:hypothetical protein BDZ90DRAFT_232789 [Jaminaea rosea]|uniref:Uncharacterized protein n=1 Tax=Jaminaea rosea TaxID=1569628 RepID=A0A316UR45_9BASI|nr:hypothetical protein BDZ90DRAFT_232789 [Jaminaea rosea]PWN27258.1 hypothetical protein BDZ90DRAFT_232789 [Jaminaea rosea]